MRRIKLLDCTLRDGGFVNDWNFGKGSIKSIIGRLDSAGVDIIEIGFLDSRRKPDNDRSIQPDTASLKAIMENIEVKHALIVAMIDFGTCGLEAIEQQVNSCIGGIRVIFKKNDCTEALKFCKGLKDKGYKVFANPVSTTSYSDGEMTALMDEINKLEPYGVSIVDTYGLMHKKELVHYYKLMDSALKPAIGIGYHSHNNFQLAYANCIELLEIQSERELILDGSLYGMGKSAGNAATELIAMHLNKYFCKHYEVNHLLEAIDVDIMREYEKKYWGYSLMHYIAASNDCHPDFVKNLIEKKTLSVKSVNEILQNLEQNAKLTYNKELIEALYRNYQNVVVDDRAAYAALAKELADRPVLMLAPGNSIAGDKAEIDKYICEKKPVVISTNFLTDKYRTDYVFFGNAKRYSQFYDGVYGKDSQIKVICTSNVTKADKSIDYLFNFNSLICSEEPIRDNPMIMLLKILVKLKIKSAALAGFDGFSGCGAANYFDEYVKFLYCDDNVVLRNELIKEKVREFKNLIELEFITPSEYLQHGEKLT
jgi:4-hydroxy 2-oxovalerate aldolase